MKKIIILSLLLITCFSCGKEDINKSNSMGKVSLLNRQWEAVSIDWFIGASGFIANTHRLNFFENDTFRWDITTREIHDGENFKYDEITYTGVYSIISDTSDRMVIELSGEDINYHATLDAERHLSIDNYGGSNGLIFKY